MIKAFQVYKENVTDNWVTILLTPSEYSDTQLLEFKKNKYILLGYSVREINN